MSNFNISENLTQGGCLNNVEQCIAKCKEQFELILSEIKKSENIEAHKVEAFIFKELLKLGLYFLECFFAKHNQGDYGGLLKTSKGIARRGRTVEKSYFSLFGKLKVKRYLYHVGAESFAPLDILLNLPKRCYSYFLSELVNFLDIKEAYLEASKFLKKFFNMDLSVSALEGISSESSVMYKDYYDLKNSLPKLAQKADLTVASFDGKGVPVIKKEGAKIKARQGKGEKKQKKKEALVGVKYNVNANIRSAEEVACNLVFPEKKTEKNKILFKLTKKSLADLKEQCFPEHILSGLKKLENEEFTSKDKFLKAVKTEIGKQKTRKYTLAILKSAKNNCMEKAENIRYIASIEQPKRQVMEQIKQEITEEDFSINPLVCVVDGAKCLSDLFEEIYKEVKNKVLILDIIHALEYIWLIANANYKESSEEGKKYVYDKLQLILHGKVASYIKELEDEIKSEKLKKSKENTYSKVIKYLKNHSQYMKYDEYLAKGYPIGSGVVESACSHVVKDRMEITGARWGINGAEAILKLRSIVKSNDWDGYWEFFTNQAKNNEFLPKGANSINSEEKLAA